MGYQSGALSLSLHMVSRVSEKPSFSRRIRTDLAFISISLALCGSCAKFGGSRSRLRRCCTLVAASSASCTVRVRVRVRVRVGVMVSIRVRLRVRLRLRVRASSASCPSACPRLGLGLGLG